MAPILVVGAGAVGARCARHLLATNPSVELLVTDIELRRAKAVAASLGDRVTAVRDPRPSKGSIVVSAVADRSHIHIARRALASNASVVSTADGLESVRKLLDLHGAARTARRHVVIGAAFSPGMSCLLARLGERQLTTVDEVHVFRFGTGGPACASHHHRALGRAGVDWRDGDWVRRAAGSGRELVWFPEPVGGADCYRAALPEPLLLRSAFPSAERITVRLAANRRNRMTAAFPMLIPPHPEGGVGGVRVELRGTSDQGRAVVALGAVGRPAVVAGIVAARAALRLWEGTDDQPGAHGLAELADPVPLLGELASHGVATAVFEGA